MFGTPADPLAQIEGVRIEGLTAEAGQETADCDTSPEGIKPPIDDFEDLGRC